MIRLMQDTKVISENKRPRKVPDVRSLLHILYKQPQTGKVAWWFKPSSQVVRVSQAHVSVLFVFVTC